MLRGAQPNPNHIVCADALREEQAADQGGSGSSSLPLASPSWLPPLIGWLLGDLLAGLSASHSLGICLLDLGMGIKDHWAHRPRMSLKLQLSAWGGGEGEEGGPEHFSKGPSKAGFIRAAADAPEVPCPQPQAGPLSQFFLSFREGKKKRKRKKGKKERRGKKLNNKVCPTPVR